MYVHGEVHKQVLPYITNRIENRQVLLEIDQDKMVDLDTHIPLDNDCLNRQVCESGVHTYVIESAKTKCPLYIIRTLEMEQFQMMINGRMTTVLINRQHKIFLQKKERYHNRLNCHVNEIYNSHLDEIKFVYGNPTQTGGLSQLTSAQLDF